MRQVFWLFLLLNTAFFYWQFTQPEKGGTLLLQPEKKAEGVESLVLLRERGLAAPAKEQQKNVLEISPADGASGSTDTAMSSPEVITANVLTEAPPEVKTALVADAATVPPGVEPEKQVEPVIVMACFTLGRFKDEAAAGKMYKALLPLGITIEQRLVERRIPKNYWVYLPPQKSYTDARQKVKALQAKGLDDMFIMGAGDMKNAVSLGLFKRKSTATARFKEVQALDSSTVMKPQFKVITEKWLELTVDSAAIETVARIAELADEYPGIELQQQKSCK